MNTSTELTLLYGEEIVGRIFDGFYEDDTWFGVFEPTNNPVDGELHRRLLDFIAFCKEWNERAQSNSGADATEFNRFDELLTFGPWAIVPTGGEVRKIAHAPVFFQGGEVSWRI